MSGTAKIKSFIAMLAWGILASIEPNAAVAEMGRRLTTSDDPNQTTATDAELLGLAESALDALKQRDFATAAIALDMIAIELRVRE